MYLKKLLMCHILFESEHVYISEQARLENIKIRILIWALFVFSNKLDGEQCAQVGAWGAKILHLASLDFLYKQTSDGDDSFPRDSTVPVEVRQNNSCLYCWLFARLYWKEHDDLILKRRMEQLEQSISYEERVVMLLKDDKKLRLLTEARDREEAINRLINQDW